MRVLFWGTPDFALPSLRALLGEGHDVVGVVTRPDRPAGRGRAIRPPAVKLEAEEEAIPVLQPERPVGDEFLARLDELEPEISVVVAYGQILKPAVLELPTLGSINVHASLLPRLRGAAPINWAIVRGETETGVTVMRMVAKMDAGPILYQIREPILPEERAADLAGRLSDLGAQALIEALALLEVGELEEVEQDDSMATYAPRIDRDDARLDWSLPATEVERWIRGLDDLPGAWTTRDGVELKVYRPRPEPTRNHDAEPGMVLAVSTTPRDGMLVACGSGAVWVREVKPAGKRRMPVSDWVRGRAVAIGDRFV